MSVNVAYDSLDKCALTTRISLCLGILVCFRLVMKVRHLTVHEYLYD